MFFYLCCNIYPEYTGDTITVNGVERTVYNSNGDRITKSEPALRNFWNWFGDSKVVDDKGRPLVVYHGTTREFNSFDLTKSRNYPYYSMTFFSDNKTVADSFRNKTQTNIMPVYLKMENPFIIDEKGADWHAGMEADWWLSMKPDNDGIIVKNIREGGYGSEISHIVANDYIITPTPELNNIRNIIYKTLSMEPVSALTGQEFQKDGTPLTTKVNDYYKENYNNQVERDGVGVIKLDMRSIKDSMAHGIGKEKSAAFMAVPEIIKNGLIFDEQTQWKGRNYDSVSFIAPITINGERYACEVIVKKTEDRTGFYLHNVEIENKLADVLKTRPDSEFSTGTTASSKLSIAKKWEQVKTTSQIKSTQNRGTFSPDTGNVYKQRTQSNGHYDPELSFIALNRPHNIYRPFGRQFYLLKIFSGVFIFNRPIIKSTNAQIQTITPGNINSQPIVPINNIATPSPLRPA